MQEINLRDETFDKNQSLHYHLSLQVDTQSLTYCVLDTIRNKYTGLRHYAMNGTKDWHDMSPLATLLASDDILRLPFKSTCFMMIEGKSTLVPQELFDSSNADALFNFNHYADGNQEVLYNNLQHSCTSNVFAIPVQVHSTFSHMFPGIKVCHRASPFIENLIHESDKSSKPKCFVSIHPNTIDIGVAQQKKLLFMNTFGYREKSDIAYFILSVLDKFELPVQHTEVYFSADMENSEGIFDFLNHYLNHIKFIRPGEHFLFSYIFDDMHLTRFANLFNLALCVS